MNSDPEAPEQEGGHRRGYSRLLSEQRGAEQERHRLAALLKDAARECTSTDLPFWAGVQAGFEQAARIVERGHRGD